MALDSAQIVAAVNYSSAPEQEPSNAAEIPQMSSSAHRVLNTVELLEHILLRLDMRTLPFSQRVNRHFKAVVNGSLKLQQALYFKLDSIKDHECLYHEDRCELNPMLVPHHKQSWPARLKPVHDALKFVAAKLAARTASAVAVPSSHDQDVMEVISYASCPDENVLLHLYSTSDHHAQPLDESEGPAWQTGAS